MSSIFRYFVLCVALFVGGPVGLTAASALEWTTTARALQAKAGDGILKTRYAFKNTGVNPVRIISLNTSCECTTARTSKDICAPGETGEIQVEFNVGPQTGLVERTITVITDEGATEPTILKIAVDIADLITVQPKLVFWKIGEPVVARKVTITFARPTGGTVGEVRVRGGDFTAIVTREGTDGPYQISITPQTTAQAMQTVIRFTATVDGAPRLVSLFAAVKP